MENHLILSLLLLLQEEPKPKEPPTATDDDNPDDVDPSGDVDETELVMGGLLCGNSPFGIKDSRHGMPYLPLVLFPTPRLLVIFVIGIIVVYLLGMRLLLLTKLHHQVIALFSTVTVLLVLPRANRALNVLYLSTGSPLEVQFASFLLLFCPLTLLLRNLFLVLIRETSIPLSKIKTERSPLLMLSLVPDFVFSIKIFPQVDKLIASLS
jgi:hypothetical protein